MYETNSSPELKTQGFSSPKIYKIHCIDWNPRHVKFDVFDPPGANCGTLTILTDDVLNFVKNSWNGDIFWHGKMPKDFIV